MRMRFGMNYKSGDIVLVKFPFTNLKKSKKRPVLVIKDTNDLSDIICFQITSNGKCSNILEILNTDLQESVFSLVSYVKYDKCFTLNSEIVDKKIGKVSSSFLLKLKQLFCNEL